MKILVVANASLDKIEKLFLQVLAINMHRFYMILRFHENNALS